MLRFRAAQREFMRGLNNHRLAAFVARRQYGKTTTLAAFALKRMMKERNHSIIFGSATLNLSREIVRKEADTFRRTLEATAAQKAAKGQFRFFDARNQKLLDNLDPDDFAELFESQRLEVRYMHNKWGTAYSRTKIVALTPDTVGETGDLMCDEIRAIKRWQEVWEAVEPIISSDREFRLTLSTTPPVDDTHYGFTMLCPPMGAELPVNPSGNWYRSDLGIWVLRVSAYDAWADGVPIFDLDTGEPLPPDEHFRRALDKDAWRRNYGTEFVLGGTGAVSILALYHAQQAGVNQCRWAEVSGDGDLAAALDFLKTHLGGGRVGVGWDLATTENQTSNPSALTVLEESGGSYFARLVLVWKTADPERAAGIVTLVLDTIAERLVGGKARRLCIDATNERYFAQTMRKRLGARVPVELVISSETITVPGATEPMTMKTFLGTELVNELEEGRVPLPPELYIKEDFRLVKRAKGSFDTDTSPDGRHGDTFDATKLALRALRSNAGAILSTAGIVIGEPSLRHFQPRRMT